MTERNTEKSVRDQRRETRVSDDSQNRLLDELDLGRSTTRLAMILAAGGLGTAAFVAIVLGG
ncbi:MAG: hypothetical protein ACOC05_11465 [Oceanicaulis sp.]